MNNKITLNMILNNNHNNNNNNNIDHSIDMLEWIMKLMYCEKKNITMNKWK